MLLAAEGDGRQRRMGRRKKRSVLRAGGAAAAAALLVVASVSSAVCGQEEPAPGGGAWAAIQATPAARGGPEVRSAAGAMLHWDLSVDPRASTVSRDDWLVLVGGTAYPGGTETADTWLLNATGEGAPGTSSSYPRQWVRVGNATAPAGAGAPPAVRSATLNAVPGAGMALHFGGVDTSSGQTYSNRVTLAALDETLAGAQAPLGVRWTPQNPAMGSLVPSARCCHAGAYSATSDEMLIHGGFSDVTPGMADLWVFDRAALTWRELATTGTAPSERYFHAGVVSTQRNLFIVFGGYVRNPGTASSALYRLDLATNAWVQVSPVGTVPSPRFWASLAWADDPLHAPSGALFIVGGWSDTGATNVYNDTYSYNELAGRLTRHAGIPGPTGPRGQAAAAFNRMGDLWLHGGSAGPGTAVADTQLHLAMFEPSNPFTTGGPTTLSASASSPSLVPPPPPPPPPSGVSNGADGPLGLGLNSLVFFLIVAGVGACCFLLLIGAIALLARSRSRGDSETELTPQGLPATGESRRTSTLPPEEATAADKRLSPPPTPVAVPSLGGGSAAADHHLSGSSSAAALATAATSEASSPASTLSQTPNPYGVLTFAASSGGWRSIPELVDAVDKSPGQSAMKLPEHLARESISVDALDVSQAQLLGQGAFGVVYSALLRRPSEEPIPVAVKEMFAEGVNTEALDEFVAEAALMARIPPHPNVVRFLGVTQDPFSLLLEYIELGDLCSYLKDRSDVDLQQRTAWIFDTAKGMAHLAAQGIVHRDLAARNVLLRRDLTCVIADMGMSRLRPRDAGAVYTQTTVGPLKWMAPSSVQRNKFSQATDVFSFSILCCEILTGEEPYAGMDPVAAVTCVVAEGLRPTLPQNTPTDLAQLIATCWATDDDDRPTFAAIVASMEAMF